MGRIYGNAVAIDGGEVLLSINIDGGEVGVVMPILPAEYHGPTTITPSGETQILNTAGLLVTEDLTINPIPSNYGLITWNGSTLTVS